MGTLVTGESAADLFGRMFADIERRESQLTEWERKFVDQLNYDYSTKNRAPTPKQQKIFDEIWEKATKRG